ncbi:unnamed protein product [Symbiodinium sp. CCMP2592]|nr:unnamed protein product [Symbiodinium sp. CCMP2592]
MMSEAAQAKKSCGRCRWLSHGAYWTERCTFTDSDGVVRTWLQRAVHEDGTFGLECRLCKAFAVRFPEKISKSSPYVEGKVVPRQLEDLLRHAGDAKKSAKRSLVHQQALDYHLSQSAEQGVGGSEPSRPSYEPAICSYQVLMSVETAHTPNAAQCSLYEAKCKQGNADNPALCPLARSSGVGHWKIQHSLSVHLWRSCRSKFKAHGGARVLSIGLAEEPRDARGKFELLKARIVYSDFTVGNIVVDLFEHKGRKTALDKAQQIRESLLRFADGNDAIMDVLSRKTQVFCSDGERAEPLSARLAKEQHVLPSLKAVLRCSAHSAHKALENSLASDPRAKDLVDALISAYSDEASGMAGGLARALTNSLKLADLVEKESAEQTDHLVSKMRFAAQRFGSLTEVAGHIVRNTKVLITALTKVGNQWANNLLHTCFRPKKLLLFALIAEFGAAAMRFIRKFDNNESVDGGGVGKVPALCREVALLEQELQTLFAFRTPAANENQLSEPLVLSEKYSTGFVQIMQKQFNFLVEEAIVQDGAMIFFHKGAGSERQVRRWLAKELGSMKNIIELFLSAIRAESDTGVAAALSPFFFRPDSRLDTPEQLAPLADALNIVADLGREMLLLRPTVETLWKQGHRNVEVLWGKACNHWQNKIHAVDKAVAFMLSIYTSTSELEQGFSFLQMFGHLFKNRIDGPKPYEIATRSSKNGVVTLVPQPICFAVQKIYEELYGAKQKGVATSTLPRRVQPVLGTDKEKPSLAGLKRKQQKEMKEAAETIANSRLNPESAEELAELAQITEKSAKKRRTEKHDKLSVFLQKYAERKAFLFEYDLREPGETENHAKLQRHLREAEQRKSRLLEMTKRSMATVLLHPPLPQGTLVVASDGSCKNELAAAGASFFAWPTSTAERLNVAQLAYRSRQLGEAMLFPTEESMTSFAACARLLGGHVAGPYWLQLARRDGKLHSTVCSLKRGLDQDHQLYLHKSLEEDDSGSGKGMGICVKVLQEESARLTDGQHVGWKIMDSKKAL